MKRIEMKIEMYAIDDEKKNPDEDEDFTEEYGQEYEEMNDPENE